MDSVAAQILAAEPDSLYRQAAQFDLATLTVQDLAAGFAGALRRVDESWRSCGRSQPLETSYSGIGMVLDQLQCPEYGPLLRRAGEALAAAQAQIRELQTRRMRDRVGSPTASTAGEYDRQAALVRRDLAQRLSGVGGALPPVPERTVSGTTIGIHATSTPGDGGATDAPASTIQNPPAGPPGPSTAIPAPSAHTGGQTVVSAAIGRSGALPPPGGLPPPPGALPSPGVSTLAAVGPDDLTPAAGIGSGTGIDTDLKPALGAGKDPSDRGGSPAAGTGSSMMPMGMPMGMSMGMGGGMSVGGPASGGGSGIALGAPDAAVWVDGAKPGGGNGVLGRRAKPFEGTRRLDDDELLESLSGGRNV
jgi:hypothetical protein